jgi:serine/threonine-protein kinase
LVLGDWQLVQPIARNEHAALYQARPLGQPSLGPADYLVKVARGDADPELAATLLRRERLVANNVRHPHVQVVLGSDWSHLPPYLVLANSGSLWSTPSRASIRSAIWRTRQVAAALSALHAAGWIHSRLSPDALLLSPAGHVTLGELGWARKQNTEECRGEHLLAADLRYVAPEMLCDASVLTPECDVYALGLLLIELLIGRPAVNESVGWQAGLAHLRGELADVRQFRADVPTAVVDLIARLTGREPLRRPSAQEVERALVRLDVAQLSVAKPSRTRWR